MHPHLHLALVAPERCSAWEVHVMQILGCHSGLMLKHGLGKKTFWQALQAP